MIVSLGFVPEERDQVAAMYWQAFGAKLGRVMGPAPRGIAFVRDVLDPTHALCARDARGILLGVAGFKTFQGALVGGAWADMRRHYGTFGGAWRAALLALLERDTENQRFLMDGIFVHDAARGQGVGTALLGAVFTEARKRGYAEVRLDVIDSNPRARALYLREGFIEGDVHQLGPLRHVFGFESATMMTRTVGAS
ncbi:GNAT family N-acetyltransferase [Pseudooctadecabacter jejudonensis]|uniref:Acetyltransferase (GNAT) family protein n=1 Tax=Pseudooctadecabacter jejudonensis TaxID=1391910 RepID=A0A1Y5T653_9RHOB|nr:GNAT family N-acetyltransferase [Pseudooctadecabacter jejudonensis]SLN53415.1 Acetyltransferase (GNAT) family protein [Pseudooctadecabacter jejudonensis]